MRELIIGGDGRVGVALRRHLPDAGWTSRRLTASSAIPPYDFDLLERGPLPDADVVYICAGVNGALTCSQNAQISYRTNVDGTIYVAEHYRDKAFVVWVSSTTVEWQMEHYGHQKRITETVLRAMPHVGIVRAGRVLQPEIDDLCRVMIRVGRERERNIVLWNEDERPYAG
jgi:dTDP-4-dehydrorhamnose reductase